tara:strand:+ start:6739 stop:7752 length:1014 start_codon:yes stop_codon:yes gene_type:complete
MAIKKEKVLVTGSSGYIALHCINELINAGYNVRGSLRDLNRQHEVRSSLESNLDDENLEFCQLDLLNDAGWNEACLDCDYVMHVASPFVIQEPKEEKTLIEPAVKGTLRALNSAKKNNIKKVIITSSMASIAYGHNKEFVNNRDWTDSSKNVGAYIKSKTLAEKAAWEFVRNNSDNDLVLTTIHPGMVFGPVLSKDIEGASVGLISNLIKGKFPALPDLYFTVVDVRDVAKLHVQSLKNEGSNNKRLISTSQRGISFLEISKLLRELGYDKSPLNLIPNKVINSLAPFNKEMRSTALMIKRGCYAVDISETKSLFNWEPINLKKTLKDMTESLEKLI